MASQSTVAAPSKRKAISTRAPRPRKKQAVTKTFKRSTFQKIQQNALNSPLLSLPGEIREKILKLVIGDKVIHFNVCNFGVKGQVELGYHQGSLCHSICTGPGKNCECFTHDQRLPIAIGNCHCRSTSYSPLALNEPSLGPRFYQGNTLQISILATSRQLYEECNLLIWHTNIFSFEDPSAFTMFLKGCNTQQIRNLRNLQITPLAGQFTQHGQHSMVFHITPTVKFQQWNLGDGRDPLIHRFRGVKSLRIHMRYVGSQFPIERRHLQLELAELALSSLQALRWMPLEHAMVKFDVYGGAEQTLYPRMKLLAAVFQKMPLDPAGPERVKEFGGRMKGKRLHSQFPDSIFSSQDMSF